MENTKHIWRAVILLLILLVAVVLGRQFLIPESFGEMGFYRGKALEEFMAKEMELAGKWREATRAVFAHYLAQGYEIREFIRGERVSSYLLEGPDQGSQSLSGKTAS